VLMSGEHPAVVADALAGAQVHAFLEKPFRLEEMQSALASASS
jgi:FixJ family two-component response regulator